VAIGTDVCSDEGMEVDPPKVTVFLLDDHELVREGVRQLLEADGTIEVVGEAATCADAITRIRATRPQVAVLDVQLPDGTGVEVCREVRSARPDLACLMLTSFSDEEALFQSVMAGAAGYVLKQIRGNDLVSAVHRVARGESLIDPALTGQLLERLRNPQQAQDPRLAALTDLERTILDLVAEGLTNRQIAVRVNRAEKTVKNYMSSILMKLGMTRRTEAAVFAVRAKSDN
jgi:two-component system response regulator DevR